MYGAAVYLECNRVSKQDILLSEYRPEPELVRKVTRVYRSKYPCIDAHCHVTRWVQQAGGPEAIDRLVALMDECNIRAIFDLDGNLAEPFENVLGTLKKRYPGRFYTLVALPWERLIAEGDDFGKRAAALLRELFEQGADGLKIHKTMGLRLRDRRGRLVHYDDDRLEPVFEVCARYGRPCLFHIADPTAFFKPLSPRNERWEELQAHPTWQFHGPEYPTFVELMEIQDRFVGRYPDVVFQSAHVCSYSENLAFVSDLLDRHRNLCCDLSARIAELGRVPRAAREFLIRYQDRILFGTDVPPRREHYRVHFRFFETDDEYFDYSPGAVPGQGRWCIYGLDLPDEVLEKVYFSNAVHLYGEPRG